MRRSHRAVHLISLLAVVIGLWSPIFALPVTAATDLPQPDLSLNTDMGSGFSTPESDQPGSAVPVLPELIPVIPVLPTLADTACIDGAVYAQEAVEVPTDGIGYTISSPNETGAFIVTATLIDANIYTWSQNDLDGWEVSGNTASASGVVALCPVSEEKSAPPATAAADTTDEPQTDEGEIELSAATAAADPNEDDSTDELEAPTTGRGPARENGDSQLISITAAETELSISKTANPTANITPGDTIIYIITVTNDTGTEQHYNFEDSLPAGVTITSMQVPYPTEGDACTGGSAVVFCGLADDMVLYPGWADVWTISVTVNDDAASETTCPTGLVNTVTGNWGGTATATTTFAASACATDTQLSITLTANNPVFLRNESQYSFTVTLTNMTPDEVTAATFDFEWPTEYWFYDSWVVTQTGTIGTCIGQGAVFYQQFCYDFSVPAKSGDTPGTLDITFTHTLDPTTSYYECDEIVTFKTTLRASSLSSQDITDYATMRVDCAVQWEMDVSVNKTLVIPGETVIYSFNLTALEGSLPAYQYSRLLFSFYYPNNVVDIEGGYTGSGLDCSYLWQIDGFSYECFISGNTAISAGDTFSIDIPMQVQELNTGTNCSIDPGEIQTRYSKFFSWIRQPVLPAFPSECSSDQLQLDLSTNVQNVVIGDNFNYQVATSSETLEYDGAVSWKLTLPAGVVVDPPGSLPDECVAVTSFGRQSVSCNFDRIFGRGDTSTTTIPVTVSPENYQFACDGLATGDTFAGSAEVTGTSNFWDPDFKTDSVSTSILCDSNLTMTVSVSPAVVNPGDPYVLRFDVSSGPNQNIPLYFGIVFGGTPGSLGFLHTNRLLCEYDENVAIFGCNESDPNTDTSSDFNEPYWAELQLYMTTSPSDGTCTSGIPIHVGLGRGPWDTGNSQLNTTVNVNCQQLSISTDVNTDSVSVGEEFEYTVTVANDGRSSHGSYVFTDTLPPGIELADTNAITSPVGTTCTPAIAAGITTITCESETGPPVDGTHDYSYRVRANYALDNDVCGGASSTATGTTGRWVQDSATASTKIECVSEITITNAPFAAQVAPDGTIGYDIVVKNTGDVPVPSGTITNMLPPLPEGGEWSFMVNGTPVDVSPFDYEFTELATHEEITFRIESSVIPDDLQLPETEWCTSWTNTIEVEGVSSEAVSVGGTESAAVQVNCTGLTIDMSVADTLIPVGGQVEYTITVTNNGNTTVSPLYVYLDRSTASTLFSNLQASDEDAVMCGPINGLNPGCEYASLDSQKSVTLTVSGDAPTIPTWEQCTPVESVPVFGFEVNPGTIQTQSGIQQPGTWVSGNPVSTQIDCQPEVTIGMSGDVDTGDNDRIDAGDTVTFTIEVLNSGNMTLYETAVTANPAGLIWNTDLIIPELLPGETETFTATYTITQGDIDNGELTYGASVLASLVPEASVTTVQFIGLAQAGAPLPVITDAVSSSVSDTLVLSQEPGIDLAVSGEPNTGDDSELNEGDTITYHYTVTNSGNVTMSDFELGTDMDGLVFADGTSIASLAPGGEATLTATYTVMAADVAAGAIEMCADISAVDPGSTSISDTDQCVEYDVAQPLPTTPTPTATPATPTSTSPPATPTPATPEPDTPALATPDSAIPEPETPAAVTSLPETGFGGLAGMAPVLGLAAIMAMVLLAAGAAGVRRRE